MDKQQFWEKQRKKVPRPSERGRSLSEPGWARWQQGQAGVLQVSASRGWGRGVAAAEGRETCPTSAQLVHGKAPAVMRDPCHCKKAGKLL